MADTRVTPAEARVLGALLTTGPQYSAGLFASGKLSRGSAYTLLARLEGKGYVYSWIRSNQPHEMGRPRRYYEATPAGRLALLKHNAERDLKPPTLTDRVERLEEQVRKLIARLQRVEGERMVMR